MRQNVFKKVVLVGRLEISGVTETLRALYQYLQTQQLFIGVERHTSRIFADVKSLVIVEDDLFANYDLMIVVGGDGSILSAARIACLYNIPVLGINRGKLGFLTDIHPDELNKIEVILQGDYFEEKRFLLEMQLWEGQKCYAHQTALNDIVLLPSQAVHLILFEIYINEHFVCKHRADGLIVATPTGSTAYALSGGGPILSPNLDAVVLVPMFSHNLSSRPIVIDGNSQIEIRISALNKTSPFVSCDGQEKIAIIPGGSLRIYKKHEQLRLIHPQDYNYFATLREKLHWENHIGSSW